MKQITIGRNTNSNIVVDSTYNTVSSNHATIIEDNGRIIFKDHSSNGSYVNGRLVHQTQAEIQMCDTIFLSRSYQLDMNQVRRYLGLGRETQCAPQQNDYTMQDLRQQHVVIPQPQVQYQQQIVIPQPQVQYQQPIQQEREKPKYLNKWNWGAFYFSWLWGVCNGVYWPLIVLIPYVGQIAALIICFVLGANGSRYAWDKFNGSASDFDLKQEAWAKAAGVCFCITIILIIIFIFLIVANS